MVLFANLGREFDFDGRIDFEVERLRRDGGTETQDTCGEKADRRKMEKLFHSCASVALTPGFRYQACSQAFLARFGIPG